MRASKFSAVLASLAITTGVASVLASAPAEAATATPVNIHLVLGARTALVATYQEKVGSFQAWIDYTPDGSSVSQVTAGKAVLQRKLPGGKWRNVKTDKNVSTVGFGKYGGRALGNMKYRVHYLGGTDGTTTWRAGYSNVVSVDTLWNLHQQATCLPKCRLYGRLSPNAAHQKIVIQAKHGSTWRHYETVRANSHSRWSAPVKATRGHGTIYRAVVMRTKNEDATAGQPYRFYNNL